MPYLFRRASLPGQPAKLGGSWISLVTVHIGGVLLWASIFAGDDRAVLHGAAYAFWAVSLFPILIELWRIVRAGLARAEAERASGFAGEAHL